VIEPLFAPRSRAERLIAAGRVVLAASSLLAVWLDPSEPSKYAGIAYALLVAYLGYAVAIALGVWRTAAPANGWPLVTHAFDLVFFSLFIYFTAGTDSPFTAFFVFALVCATLRWRWRGALWTAVASLAAFLAVGFWFGEVLDDPDFQLHTFIIRGVYLAVMAALLGYLGAFEHRARREMGLLAAWPREVPADADSLVGEVLAYAARVLGAPRAALVWVEQEEPWLHLALRADGGVTRWREPPATFQPWVAEPLAGVGFLVAGLGSPSPSVRLVSGGGEAEAGGEPPLHPGLAGRLGADTALTVPLTGETFEGLLLILDRPGMTADELVLGEVVAGVATARIDHYHLHRRLAEVAATEERIRLSRDLHDGVLQSLTGIALRLAAARRMLDDDPEAGVERLEAVQRLIALEQRDLRFFIQELQPSRANDAARPPALGERLAELVDRAEREWDLRVDLDTAGLGPPVAEPLGREIYLIVREALVNAVRHGEASKVWVEIGGGDGDGVRITVRDNGRGFPFEGRFGGDELARMNAAPRTLGERVAALRGALTVDSGPAGASLEIALPTGGGAA
jgi:signal transduction histidine kinase